MKNMILLLFAFQISGLLAQDIHGIPEFQRFEFISTYRINSDLNKDTLFWCDKNIKVEFTKLTDSTFLRKDYFESGNLKRQCEIFIEYREDTQLLIDPITLEEEYKILIGFKDFLNGSYIEYSNVVNSNERVEGNFKMNKKVGNWISRSNEYYRVMSFDTKGNPLPKYYEYYYNSNLRVSGEFGRRQYKEELAPDGMISNYISRNQYRRVGGWKFYDINGNVIQEINYQWKAGN